MQGSTLDTSNTAVGYETEVAGGHHEEHPDHRIFGVIMFLIAESMIFSGAICCLWNFPVSLTGMAPRRHPGNGIISTRNQQYYSNCQ